MSVQWTTVAAVVTTVSFVGGIMLVLMRRFFVSTEKCEITHKNHAGEISKKIDDLKTEIKEDRVIANNNHAETKETLGLIQGKLESL